MAVATRTESRGRTYTTVYSLTTADPTGDAAGLPGASDRSVHIFAANWGAATLVIEGSNEDVPTDWVVLDDTFDTALSFTTGNHMRTLNANIKHIRARLSVAGTAAAVTVILLERSTMK